MQYGANPNIVNNKGEIPVCLSIKPSISKLLGRDDNVAVPAKEPNFIPGYIEHPPLFVDLLDLEPTCGKRETAVPFVKETSKVPEKGKLFCCFYLHFNLTYVVDLIIIRARVANSDDPDYIEFDMPKENMTYQSLVKRCCEELEINQDRVAKVKKGSVRLRNDADVRRFNSLVCLDLHVKDN